MPCERTVEAGIAALTRQLFNALQNRQSRWRWVLAGGCMAHCDEDVQDVPQGKHAAGRHYKAARPVAVRHVVNDGACALNTGQYSAVYVFPACLARLLT